MTLNNKNNSLKTNNKPETKIISWLKFTILDKVKGK